MECVLKPKVVLMVDDMANDREIFRTATAGLNMDLLLAENGTEALRILAERPDIEMLVLDSRLPDIQGIDVFKKLKQLGDKRPVIFWTGACTGALAKAAQDVGFALVVAKPSTASGSFIREMLKTFGVREKPLTDSEKQRKV
jgi:CheY-like chemotaxis protein